jgi:hypothetical protein
MTRRRESFKSEQSPAITEFERLLGRELPTNDHSQEDVKSAPVDTQKLVDNLRCFAGSF